MTFLQLHVFGEQQNGGEDSKKSLRIVFAFRNPRAKGGRQKNGDKLGKRKKNLKHRRLI